MKARISQICRRSLVVVLCPLLLLQPLFARQTSTQSGIRIVVVRGDRARNVIQQIPAEPLTVRVEDLNRQPIAGVTVIFTAPATGPSGDFATGSTIANVIANQDGLAIAEGYHPNGIVGSYLIQLRAQYLQMDYHRIERILHFVRDPGSNAPERGQLVGIIEL